MINLETDRLIFRQWQATDFPIIEQFFKSKEHTRYIGGVKKSESAWRLIATYIGHYHLHGYSYLAVEEKESSSLIGSVGLWNSVPWPEPELGYWLLPSAQGKGFGFEASAAVKQYALDDLNFESLVSYINAANQPSLRLATKLGATYDGLIDLLDFGRHQVYRYW